MTCQAPSLSTPTSNQTYPTLITSQPPSVQATRPTIRNSPHLRYFLNCPCKPDLISFLLFLFATFWLFLLPQLLISIASFCASSHQLNPSPSTTLSNSLSHFPYTHAISRRQMLKTNQNPFSLSFSHLHLPNTARLSPSSTNESPLSPLLCSNS